MDKGELKMVKSAKKRMCLAELVYKVYNCFEDERGFDLRVDHIAEKAGSYEILIKYRTNPKQKEKEYFDYFNIMDYNRIIRLDNRYDISTYNGIIAKLIAERLKREIRINKLYD